MPKPILAAEHSPGRYMRSCRQRAGLSIAQVAETISANGEHRYTARNLRALEQDQPGDYAQLIDTLHAHQPFAFDHAILLGRMAKTADPAFEDLPTRIAA